MGGDADPDPASQEHPDNQKMVHEGWKDLKEKKRGCTDFLFLVSCFFVMKSIVILT